MFLLPTLFTKNMRNNDQQQKQNPEIQKHFWIQFDRFQPYKRLWLLPARGLVNDPRRT